MAVDGARRRRSMRQAAPTREGRLRTIDQTAHRGAARLISVHINELPSSRKASAHRRGPPRTARPKPPSAYSADGGFQLPVGTVPCLKRTGPSRQEMGWDRFSNSLISSASASKEF